MIWKDVNLVICRLSLSSKISATEHWNNEGFYPVWNEQNEIYQRALDLFEEADALVTN